MKSARSGCRSPSSSFRRAIKPPRTGCGGRHGFSSPCDPRSWLRALVGAFADCGITNVLALRGDPQGGVHNEWHKHPQGLEFAVELVELISSLGDFHVGVASFPEGHPRAIDLEQDTANLVAKLRAGAEYSITQMFFDVDGYLRLRDRVAAADPEVGSRPIIPGMMPITSLRVLRRQVELSGSQIPAPLLDRLTDAAAAGKRRTATRCARSALNWPPR
jgi:methylenetetrahydrofolate reductase (NADPH)